MNNMRISMRTSATASAAFVAHMTGYVDIDALMALEQAKSERIAKATSTACIRLQGTSGGVDLFKTLQKGSYFLSDCIVPPTKNRNVSRVEDLILRRATLRAGSLISKGRFLSK